MLGIQHEVYCINRAGRQLFPQGRCTGRGNSRSFHRDWTVGLLYSPSTSKRCQTCQKPAASKRPCVGSRALSMVLTMKRGHRCKGTPRELWSRLPYCTVWHPRSLLLLPGLLGASVSGAGTRGAGRVAAGALATLCGAQAPTADTAQGNQLWNPPCS